MLVLAELFNMPLGTREAEVEFARRSAELPGEVVSLLVLLVYFCCSMLNPVRLCVCVLLGLLFNVFSFFPRG